MKLPSPAGSTAATAPLVVIVTSRFRNAGFVEAGLPHDNRYLNDIGKQERLFTLNARATLSDLPIWRTKEIVSVRGRNLTNKQQVNFLPIPASRQRVFLPSLRRMLWISATPLNKRRKGCKDGEYMQW